MTAPEPNIQLVSVFRTGDPGLAGIVASVLQGAGIDYTMKGGTMYGGLMEFQVRDADAQHAALLLTKLG